jgi:hypothetical protein
MRETNDGQRRKEMLFVRSNGSFCQKLSQKHPQGVINFDWFNKMAITLFNCAISNRVLFVISHKQIQFVFYRNSDEIIESKDGKDGSNKKRICWDGSRCVNLSIKEQKVTLSASTSSDYCNWHETKTTR